jgi:hypothetical protein
MSVTTTHPRDPAAEDLPVLAARINQEHAAGEAATRKGLAHFLAAGRALIVAKSKCRHGQWESWVKDNLKMSLRRAQRYMALAQAENDVTSDLEEAWRIISGNAPEVEDDDSGADEPGAGPRDEPAEDTEEEVEQEEDEQREDDPALPPSNPLAPTPPPVVDGPARPTRPRRGAKKLMSAELNTRRNGEAAEPPAFVDYGFRLPRDRAVRFDAWLNKHHPPPEELGAWIFERVERGMTEEVSCA